MPFGRVLAVALLCHGVIAGPSEPGDQTLAARSAPRKLHGRFLHITDIHPDEYYKVHSSTDEDDGCHRGRGPAGPYGAETSDCDSPFSLVNATFDWIDANLKDEIDFIVWTGDSARHDRDEDLPRNADQVLGTNRWISDKFFDMLADKGDKGMTIPVVPNFGNNDILPHNILLPGPNKWFQHYSHIWRHFIPEEQRHSFEYGGWFNVEVIPNKLAVFSLNTLYLFDRNAGVDGCASPSEPGYKQMEWLRVQLQFMRDRGMKAILIGHVPPARTESKMLWDETCWQKYSLWMHQFRDVVVVGLYGHMNIDHFLIHDKNEINIAALEGSEFGTREAMDDELTTQSASDYLMELRSGWAKLDAPLTPGKDVNKEGKRKKGKHRRDPWGERYHLSLVSPSVVPNYFPTLRVFEYNITGLEDTPLWRDAAQGNAQETESTTQKHIELRQLPTETGFDSDLDLDFDLVTDDDSITATKKKDKNKKKKHGKPKKPPAKEKDPNLHIPLPPSKSSPPGPAYSSQPLTLTGYTQYFANLTHINNLNLTADNHPTNEGEDEASNTWWPWTLDLEWDGWLLRWRKGKHGGKKPVVAPRPAPPREFAFEVEYSTFEDAIYRLGDLTVNSMVGLAVRMGGPAGGKGLLGEGEGVAVADGGDDESEICEDDEDDYGDEYEDEGDDDDSDDGSDDDGEVEIEKKKKKKGKGRKGKKGKKKKHNKTWLHFLRHAFVGTLEKDDLEGFL